VRAVYRGWYGVCRFGQDRHSRWKRPRDPTVSFGLQSSRMPFRDTGLHVAHRIRRKRTARRAGGFERKAIRDTLSGTREKRRGARYGSATAGAAVPVRRRGLLGGFSQAPL